MKRICTIVGAILALVGFSATSGAEPLRVGLDKYELVRFNESLATVLIANPNIVDVGVESTRLIILVGRTPGETMLVVLDDQDKEILKTNVVVVPNLERQVTLYRGLAEATFSCDPRCAAIPNPGAGVVAPVAPTPAAEEEAAEPAAPTAEEIAAAAAAAAAAAVAGPPPEESQ